MIQLNTKYIHTMEDDGRKPLHLNVAPQHDETTNSVAPSIVWATKAKLGKNTQAFLKQTPVMCINDFGELDIDAGAIETAMQNNDENLKDFLSTFSKVMKELKMKKQFKFHALQHDETRSPSPVRNPKNQTLPMKSKFKSRSPAIEAPLLSSFDSKLQSGDYASTLRVFQDSEDLPAHKKMKCMDSETEDNYVTVPHGATPGDRLALFNTETGRKMKSSHGFIIPPQSCAGMSLGLKMPPNRFKIVMEDGDGEYLAGGTNKQQHAVRLEAHRKRCQARRCPIQGCGKDPIYKVYKKSVASADVVKYEQFYSMSRAKDIRAYVENQKLTAESAFERKPHGG